MKINPRLLPENLLMVYPKTAYMAVLILISLNLFGQYDELDFKQYTVKDGLSDNNISCISQDNHGLIWIGTEFGLNRYDGNQFEKYYQGSLDDFLTSSIIHKIKSFRNERLAIITKNGLQVVNTKDFSIRQYAILDSTRFSARLNYFNDAIELQDGTVGASASSGFYVFDTTGAVVYRHDAFNIDDIGKERIMYARQILSIPDGSAFIYLLEYGQGVFDPARQQFREVRFDEEKWKMFSQPPPQGWRGISQISDHEYMFLSRTDSLIYFDYNKSKRLAFRFPAFLKDVLTWESYVFMLNDSTFFINGGYQGFYVFKFDRNINRVTFDPQLYLNEFKIRCFYEDHQNRLWVGTTDGLLKQNTERVFARTYHLPVEDHSRIGYSDAYRYKDKIYVSRFSRDIGLVIINAKTMEIEKQFSFFGLNNSFNEVYSIRMYHTDTLWIGTFGGLLWFDTKRNVYGKVKAFSSIQHVSDWSVLSPAQHGSAWINNYLGGNVLHYLIDSRKFDLYNGHSEPVLPFARIKHICTDAYGDTWLAGHSLARWNNKQNTFDTLITVYGGPNKYDDDIKLIRADNNGSLWMHNDGNGLLQYKVRDRKWIHYGMEDGFPSEIIKGMSPVLDNTLWMTSQNQLVRVDVNTGKIQIYDQSDGIPDIKPLAWTIAADTVQKDLYIFYKDDVAVMPYTSHEDTTWKGEILFSEVKINNDHSFFFPDKELKFRTAENNLTIHFTIVDFDNGSNTKFAYKINEEDEWIDLGNQRVLHLINLAPGSYNVEIKATGKSGIQNVSTLTFSVAPPFWKSSWFIIICLVFASSIIYLFYKWRMSQFQQKANLDRLLSKTEMKALHAQMNPHFIFNSLNSIREMVLSNNPQQASRFLGNFAHLIRLTLDQSTQSFISLRQTMDYIRRYIEMEKIRNPDFHFSMEADETLDPDETFLPPLLIQPFVENAIWHGMNGDEKEINIEVHFSKNEDQLVCTIEDDGIGIETSLQKKNTKNSGHRSVSIANIKKRIELLNQKHDLRSSIVIIDKNMQADQAGTGTIVKIALPLNMIEAWTE